MATFANITNQDGIIKEYYMGNKVPNLTYPQNPLYGLISKDREWSGENLRLPAQYQNPVGMSATFSTAQSNQAPSAYANFAITPSAFYSLASVTGPVILQTRNDRGAFVNVLTREINSSMRAHTNLMQAYLYGDGSGMLAQVSAVDGTNVVTLKDKTMTARFTPGMMITSCADLTGGTPATAVALTAVNRTAGTLTFDTAYPTGTVADWYLFMDGSYNNVPTGLAGWNPVTAPTSGDSFWGVDRSVDPDRLAGARMGAKGLGMMQTLNTLAYKIFAISGKLPDICFLNPNKMTQLIAEIQGQSIFRPEPSSPGDAPSITYGGARVTTAWGDIKLHPDVYAPSQEVRMGRFEDASLYIQQDLVSIIEDDNQRILRTASDDGIEVRIRSYFNMGFTDTAAWGVADFDQAA